MALVIPIDADERMTGFRNETADYPPSPPVAIASIFPSEVFWDRPYGHYLIGPAEYDDQFQLIEPTVLVIEDAKDRRDFGEGNMLWTPVLALSIAEDLVREERKDIGLFICGGLGATPEELKKAHRVAEKSDTAEVNTVLATFPTTYEVETAKKRRVEWLKDKIVEGDEMWARSGDPKWIDDNSRRACLELNIKREWSKRTPERKICPACSSDVLPSAILCRECNYILDASKYDPRMFATPGIPASPPKKPGRPKKVRVEDGGSK